MKKIVAMSVCVGFALQLSAGTDTLFSKKDTYARAAVPMADYGKIIEVMFWQQGSRVIMEYDLSGIKGTVTGATLKFRMANNIDKNWNVEVFPMVYTKNNYSWKEGTGQTFQESAAASGAACYALRDASKSAPWEDASGSAVANITASGLWDKQIGQEKGTDWAKGKFVTVTLDAETVERYRKEYGTIVLGLWDQAMAGAANGFTITTREAAVAGNRPVLTIISAP